VRKVRNSLGDHVDYMQTSVGYARIFVCAILLVSSLSVLAVPVISGNGQEPRHGESTTITITTWNTATIISTEWNTTTIPTTRWKATTQTSTATSWTATSVFPTVLGVFPVNQATADMFAVAGIGLLVLALVQFGSVLILRSRASKTLEELNAERRMVLELRSELSGFSPETAYSASYALKRLLEMGVLQPKEYMEKKILAERLEKKMSAKQLLDEGLISKEQYEALARREKEQGQT
jgi:hypothetical protein